MRIHIRIRIGEKSPICLRMKIITHWFHGLIGSFRQHLLLIQLLLMLLIQLLLVQLLLLILIHLLLLLLWRQLLLLMRVQLLMLFLLLMRIRMLLLLLLMIHLLLLLMMIHLLLLIMIHLLLLMRIQLLVCGGGGISIAWEISSCDRTVAVSGAAHCGMILIHSMAIIMATRSTRPSITNSN
jgi:hypothetical protein